MKKKAIAFNADELIRSVEQARDAVSCKPDGLVRFINPSDAKVVKEFMPVTVSATAANGR